MNPEHEKSGLRFNKPDDVEAVFYEAFMRCDADVMARVWARQGVLCVHPGAGAIVEYDAVVRSWANIFSDADRAELKYTVVRRNVSDDLAIHVVAEELSSPGAAAAVVLATNVYRRFGDGWLMIEHHASLMQQRSTGQTLQ